MKNIRKQFPVLGQCIYANTAASGLLYDGLLQWRQEHDLDFLIGGSRMKMNAMIHTIPEVRKTVGRFFGCKEENVALVPNFSLGLNLLLEGLDTAHKVLLLESDYPSVNWPFEERGFAVTYAALDANLEANILEKIQSEAITVLALSVVQWVNGIQIDIDFLARLKKERPELLIIADGTQFCGMTALDFESSPFDVLGASAYKWLLAGYGNGFMLFKDKVESHISMVSTGFNAANGEVAKRQRIRFAKRLEPGHLDTLNFGSLKFSLDFLDDLGKEAIEEQLRMLSETALQEFGAMSLLEDAVVSRSKHSTIFNIKGDDKVFKTLTDTNVICSQRGDGIRLSFHFYNTVSEVREIVKILKTGK